MSSVSESINDRHNNSSLLTSLERVPRAIVPLFQKRPNLADDAPVPTIVGARLVDDPQYRLH
eukprot:scaffold344954_cov35-Attheya_sp.AAC.1